jgi:tetratricopeptide (TPR) repeat protein/transcriptional regulator with XRE-family HTH domain
VGTVIERSLGKFRGTIVGVGPAPGGKRRPVQVDESQAADRIDDSSSTFGEHLRTLRMDRGLSLADLSLLVHYSKGYLSKVETGDKPPTAQLARGCDQALGAEGGLLRLLIGPQNAPATLPTPRSGRAQVRHEPRHRPAQLPAAVVDFAGRDYEIGQLDAMLAAGAPGGMLIAMIEGLGGIGKTTLALHWAHTLRSQFPDGALFADLRGYHPNGVPATPSDQLGGFLRALGVAPDAIPPDDASRSALFRSVMDGKRMLLMLDDASDTSQVEPLLPGSSGCLVVVTSRVRLSGLVVRHGARRLCLGGLPAREALALLGGIVGDQRIAAEPDAASELVTRCANLPLALRIVADRAASRPGRPLADLVAGLRSERDRLDALSVAGDATAAVASVFSWSYRALSEPVARAFRLLSLYPGLEPSVPAVAAMLDTGTEKARGLLDSLAAVHLIEESGRDGYRLHELVRLYAAERRRAEDPVAGSDAALSRLLSWYLHTADAADRVLLPQRHRQPLEPVLSLAPLDFADYTAAMSWCETERPTIVLLTHQAAARGMHELAWRLPTALWGFLSLRNHWADLIETHEVALASARAVDDRLGQAIALNNLGIAKVNVGRPDQAHTLLCQALVLRKEIGDVWGQAAVANNLGSLHRGRGEFNTAAAHHDRAIMLFRQVGDQCGEGQALNNLGSAYLSLGRLDDAIGYYRQALSVLFGVGDQLGQAETLDSLGSAYQVLDDYDAAVDCHLRAVLMFRELGDRSGEAGSLDNLGLALACDGAGALARDSWQHALALFEEVDPVRAGTIRARLTGPDARVG